MNKPHFSQTFIGVVIASVLSGVIVLLIGRRIEGPKLPPSATSGTTEREKSVPEPSPGLAGPATRTDSTTTPDPKSSDGQGVEPFGGVFRVQGLAGEVVSLDSTVVHCYGSIFTGGASILPGVGDVLLCPKQVVVTQEGTVFQFVAVQRGGTAAATMLEPMFNDHLWALRSHNNTWHGMIVAPGAALYPRETEVVNLTIPELAAQVFPQDAQFTVTVSSRTWGTFSNEFTLIIGHT